MASGSIQKKCSKCNQKGQNLKCDHNDFSYYAVYRFGEKQIWKKMGTNKKDAQRWLDKTLNAIRTGEYVQESKLTFEDFSAKWLRDYASKQVQKGTYNTYKSSIEKMYPFFGKYYMEQVTVNDVNKLINHLLKNRQPKTVNNYIKILRTMFKYAKRWKDVAIDIMPDVDNLKETQKEMDYLRPHEIKSLLDLTEGFFKALIMTALFTGMRRGELLGLQWGDIDWGNDVVSVRRSIKFYTKSNQSAQRWTLQQPKTKSSIRSIVLTPKLKELLSDHKFSESAKKITQTYGQEDLQLDDFIFTNKVGQPIDPDNMVKRSFHPALENAGLRKIRFHDLRHTYATLLLSQGHNIKFVQSQMGHASAQVTLDRYGHVMPQNSFKVGEKFDQAIFTEKEKILV